MPTTQSAVGGGDGGPAFPTDALAGTGMHGRNGMSIRDYFAAQALAGMLAGNAQALLDIRDDEATETITGRASEVDAAIAEIAFRLADAMLQQRVSG